MVRAKNFHINFISFKCIYTITIGHKGKKKLWKNSITRIKENLQIKLYLKTSASRQCST